LTHAAALSALARQPLLTLGVVARIHWQALRLFAKKVPFYGNHPAPDRTAEVPTHHRRAGHSPGSTHHSSSIEEIQP
jgi:DUF1365 family protein